MSRGEADDVVEQAKGLMVAAELIPTTGSTSRFVVRGYWNIASRTQQQVQYGKNAHVRRGTKSEVNTATLT